MMESFLPDKHTGHLSILLYYRRFFPEPAIQVAFDCLFILLRHSEKRRNTCSVGYIAAGTFLGK